MIGRRGPFRVRVRYDSFWDFWWHGWYIVPAVTCLVWLGLALWSGDPWWLCGLYLELAGWTAWQATVSARKGWQRAVKAMALADEHATLARARITALEAVLQAHEMSEEVRREGQEVLQGWRQMLATSEAERWVVNPDMSGDPASWVRPA